MTQKVTKLRLKFLKQNLPNYVLVVMNNGVPDNNSEIPRGCIKLLPRLINLMNGIIHVLLCRKNIHAYIA